jgi:hypothetical protein
MKNPVHVYRCPNCSVLFAWREGQEPTSFVCRFCLHAGVFECEHLTELCTPGAQAEHEI